MYKLLYLNKKTYFDVNVKEVIMYCIKILIFSSEMSNFQRKYVLLNRIYKTLCFMLKR